MSFFIKILLFTVPWFFVPEAYNKYELQKLLFFRIGTEALFIIYILWTISQRRPIVKWQNTLKAILAFVLVAYLASVFGVDFGQSFMGSYFRGQGLFTLFHYLMLYVVISSLGKDYFKPLVLSGFTLAVAAVLQFLIIGTGAETAPLLDLFNGRYQVVFGNPNFFGAFLALCMPMAGWFFIQEKSKKWVFVMLGLICGIVLSGSKGALLGGFFGVLGVLGGLGKLGKEGKLGILLIIIFMGVFFVNNNRNSIYENRGMIWESGAKAFLKRPILGWGPENFEYGYNVSVKDTYLSGVRVDKAHNEVIEIAVGGGILGLLAYLGIWTRLLKLTWELKENEKYLFLGVLITFAVVALTNVLSVTSYIVFWVAVGSLSFFEKVQKEVRISKWAGYLFIILLLFLIVFNFRYMLADIEFAKGNVNKAFELYPWERVYSSL